MDRRTFLSGSLAAAATTRLLTATAEAAVPRVTATLDHTEYQPRDTMTLTVTERIPGRRTVNVTDTSGATWTRRTDNGRRLTYTAAAVSGGVVTAVVTPRTGTPGAAADTYTVHTPARFAGDPGAGLLYYGMSRPGGDPSDREQQFNHPVGVFRSFFTNAGQSNQLVATASRDITAGRLPLTSIKPPGTWASVASGSQDAWLTPMLNGLATLAGPVWLCLHHEPWEDTGTGQTPDDYIGMHRRLMQLKPSNVAVAPILQASPFSPSVYGHDDPLEWFAPDACDIVGFDSYNHWSPTNGHKWREPDVCFGEAMDQVTSLGKPMLVGEYGVRVDPNQPGKAAQWLNDAHDYLTNRSDVVAMSYFDSDKNVNDGGTPWSLDWGNTERLNAYQTILTGPGNAFLT